MALKQVVQKVTVNEAFAIRDGERTTILEERPTGGRWLAVMVRQVEMPPGDRQEVRQSDGEPVEMAAIVACQVVTDGRWQWVHLTPATKETIGDLLFASGVEYDRWYYALVTQEAD